MISHTHIAARFKAGENVMTIAYDIAGPHVTCSRLERALKYVQHALREVLKRQPWQG